MQHYQTLALAKYWDELRRGRAVPSRNDIDPGRIRTLLPNVFILEFFDVDHLVFRLAGTRLCERYGREFRAHNFLSLWRGTDRFRMREFLQEVLTRPTPGLITCRAETIDRHAVDLEMIVLPLRDCSDRVTRVIGSAYPLSDPENLGHRRLVSQWLLELAYLDPAEFGGDRRSRNGALPQSAASHLRLVVSRQDV
mgnify:CR=1 FL=1